MQVMQHNLFSTYARQRMSPNDRRNAILATGMLRCLDWLWRRESATTLKHVLAEEYLEHASSKGSLDAIRYLAPYVKSAPEHRKVILLNIFFSLAQGGQDNAACRLFSQANYWLQGWPVMKDAEVATLYVHAATYATRVPNFYTLMHSTCFSTVASKFPDESESLFALYSTALLAVIGSESKFDEATFLYFWDHAPHWREVAAYDVFHDACFALVHDETSSRWFVVVSRLAYVGVRFLRSPVPEVTDNGNSFTWVFPARGPHRPKFEFSCVKEKMHKALGEVSCRISFRQEGVSWNVTMRMCGKYSPFGPPGGPGHKLLL
jgi:hypothetical protein